MKIPKHLIPFITVPIDSITQKDIRAFHNATARGFRKALSENCVDLLRAHAAYSTHCRWQKEQWLEGSRDLPLGVLVRSYLFSSGAYGYEHEAWILYKQITPERDWKLWYPMWLDAYMDLHPNIEH